MHELTKIYIKKIIQNILYTLYTVYIQLVSYDQYLQDANNFEYF